MCVECLFEDAIPPELYEEALKQACWYLDGGNVAHSRVSVRVIDWAQDEAIIFPAINKVAGKEVRAVEYIHWWTFMSWFHAIGEGQLSTVVSIRDKLHRGKKLEPWEREFYREHKHQVELKKRYTAEEIQQQEKLKAMLDGV